MAALTRPRGFIATVRRCMRNDVNTVLAAARNHWQLLAWLLLLAIAAWVLPLRAAELAQGFNGQGKTCGAVRG